MRRTYAHPSRETEPQLRCLEVPGSTPVRFGPGGAWLNSGELEIAGIHLHPVNWEIIYPADPVTIAASFFRTVTPYLRLELTLVDAIAVQLAVPDARGCEED